jgi:vacuolar-type H+-ATPase subunit H
MVLIMSINDITLSIAGSALESGAESGIAAAEERQYKLSINAREKIDKILEKTEGALEKVQNVTSKVERLNPLTQKVQEAATCIRSKRAKNQEKIRTEKLEGAWSALGKIYNGTVAKVKAGTAVATGIGSKIPETLRFVRSGIKKNPSPQTKSRFNPLRIFENLRAPQLPTLSLPEGSLPQFDPSLPDMHMPRLDMSLPDMHMPRLDMSMQMPKLEINVPDVSISMPEMPSLPSLPSAITDKVKEKAWEKVDEQIDRAMTAGEKYVKDPVKEGQKKVEDLVEHYAGDDGVQCMTAVKVIFNHHTQEYQDRASGCFGRAKDRVKQLPHWIAGSCYSLFYGSTPTQTQPVTV